MGFKMVMIVYNEAIDTEVMEVIERTNLKNYTKVMGVYGSGEASGIHLGNDIWPGRNNILYICCENIQVPKILSGIKELRKKLAKEGVKAFVWDLEDIT